MVNVTKNLISNPVEGNFVQNSVCGETMNRYLPITPDWKTKQKIKKQTYVTQYDISLVTCRTRAVSTI